jgi:hypothetical protein
VLVFFVDGLVPIDMLIFTRGCSALFLPGLKKQNQKNNVNPNKNKHEFQTEHSLKIYVFFLGFIEIFECPHQAGPSASTLRV